MTYERIAVTVDGEKKEIVSGTTLEEIKTGLESKHKAMIVAAKVNNEIRELTYKITKESDISFIDLTMADGVRIYQRSLIFLLVKAFHDIFPDEEIEVCHSVSRGLFFESSKSSLNADDVEKVEKRMQELVERNIPFQKKTITTEEAKQRFLSENRLDRYGAIKYREKAYVSYYVFDDMEDYFYGYMVPGTGYLKLFRLEYDHGGIVLISPRLTSPNALEVHEIPKKLFQIFSEYRQWVNILGVDNVGKLNDIV